MCILISVVEIQPVGFGNWIIRLIYNKTANIEFLFVEFYPVTPHKMSKFIQKLSRKCIKLC